MGAFHFQKFSVQEAGDVMPVGTDALILGAWAGLETSTRILDVGCGGGVLCLMAAQRNLKATITGIDCLPAAATIADRNFQSSPWSARLTSVQGDFLEYIPNSPIDHIISNPPYFAGGTQAPKVSRALARHHPTRFMEEFFRKSARILTVGGALSVVLPRVIREEIISEGSVHGFQLRRELRIRRTYGHKFALACLEFEKEAIPVKVRADRLTIIAANGGYTETYRSYVSSFLLSEHLEAGP